MTLAQPIQATKTTPEEYLRYEYDAQFRHEWRDGRVTLMQGGSPDHSLIIMNAGATIHARLRGSGCRVYDSNLRVRDRRTTLYTYPDLTVICGEREFDPRDEREQTVLNPKVVVEVLSPSSELDDRTEKFRRYGDIESLDTYVLVSQTSPRIETFARDEEGWLLRIHQGMEAAARLESLGVDLPLAAVYDGVTFPPPPPERVNEDGLD